MTLFATDKAGDATPIEAVLADQFSHWFDQQDQTTQNWVNETGFKAKSGEVIVVPDQNGVATRVLLGMASSDDVLQFGRLPYRLRQGPYTIVNDFSQEQLTRCACAWAFGAYRFTRYRSNPKAPALLVLPNGVAQHHVENISSSVNLVRDMINTPTQDMQPQNIAEQAERLAQEFKAQCTQIVGDDLLDQNFPVIHAVGRASVHPSRLVDLRWGDDKHPKVTLVGKGVCFDTGGLDLKPPAGMRYMKKDMAGAAHVLGLGRMIMAGKLPVRLRILIPTVENAVSGDAYRPGDIIKSRKGATIEVTNTDAEGRLILCDALTEASSENPDLLIDIATLTGAARVALGNDISAMFTQNDKLASDLVAVGDELIDPIWRLPMYEPYRKLLQSPIADLVNAVLGDPSGGAITAALFLSEFVPEDIEWVHFDIMAWNKRNRAARPEGGEAMAIRALYRYLQNRYG